VDTEGCVLEVEIHGANVPDQDGIGLLLDGSSVRHGLPRLSHPWLEAGYQGRGKGWAENVPGLSVEVVRKPPKPVPEKTWPRSGRRNGPKEAKRSTGRGSCRSGALGCCPGGGW
jgi:hypothetical protein